MPRKTKLKESKKLPLLKHKDTTAKLFLLIALFLILIGTSIISSFIRPAKNIPNVTSLPSRKDASNIITKTPIKISPTLMKEENVSEIPTRIIIPKANIDLSVTESAVKNGYWEVSENSASHGMGSANPGHNGNSVIFAHARVGLFYNLKDVNEGDDIYILTKDRWYHYKAAKIDAVFPEQTEVISDTKDERLTLYTCTGYADEKRLIVVAKRA